MMTIMIDFDKEECTFQKVYMGDVNAVCH
jgi:hypothetical protein